MPTNPRSSSRVLTPRTNTLHVPQAKLTTFLPTDSQSKKRHIRDETQSVKRRKLSSPAISESEDDGSDVDVYSEEEEVAMEDARMVQARARRQLAIDLHTQFVSSSASRCRRQAPSTLPILQSFVSSHKSDVFKCQSIGEDTYLTPPYACAYSHGSRRGGNPRLAVATEQGTVHILNTQKRDDWDSEPQRTTLQQHQNGIFDVKWNLSDTSLATSSGDQSTRISSVETGAITHVLRGHASTVKCLAWDPTNESLLTTGGRDGAICLWDLRVGERHKREDTEFLVAAPVMTIHGAHEDTIVKSKPKPRKGKQVPTPRTITNVLYPESQPYGLISSASFDGILRYWDLRQSTTTRKTKSAKRLPPTELYCSPVDPTMLHGSRRSRGIISMTCGTGPTAGLIFALGADSRIHAYDLPTLTAQRAASEHENLQTNSFYVGVSVSPCGRWLGCGGSGTTGNSFLFDVENAARPASIRQKGVELIGQKGEVGAVDWAQDMFATCTDDGTVRIWRPDIGTRRKCAQQPEESRWDWSWAM
ncbi:hypothetical protein NLJ89_g8172 [Agrocybe chaxingu]|uniref:WD40 repeat-like protein n=1 Tax=Agrocybe chaxingu TaxID=84603 RepID=A0A9W8JVE1_9AGAR|nr:hypothetical protein NLJ89_g8172 [Agrocybe chaxingu]